MRKTLSKMSLLLAPFALAATPAASSDAAFIGQPEPPLSHTGYARFAVFAKARDGVRLALTVYRPTGGVAGETRFPVLLWYHPGHRESIDPRTGTLRSTMAEADIAFFTSHGYAVAIAEMRGSGASFGTRELDRGPQIGRDGKDIIGWIASQTWSNGRIGMIGASYQGFSQYATAAERPAALKAIFPEIAGFDDYTSMFYPGGIMANALSASASVSIQRDDQNQFIPEGARQHFPSVPVIDEDGDGELADEIPLDRNGNGSFIDDGPPRYSDGKARADIYYRATLDHQGNRNLPVEKVVAAPHRNSPIDGTAYHWRDLDPGQKPERIAASGIAIYNRGGWFDYHARDTVMWQATLAGRTPSFAMMAPVGHGGLPAEGGDAIYRSGPYLAHFGDTSSTNVAMNHEKLAFFDHYVKGLPNGFEKRLPVLIYVMGKGWRREAEWPLARAKSWHLALGAGGALEAGVVQTGKDLYPVDLRASSLSDDANRWNFGVSRTRKVMTLDGGQGKRLSYMTAPLIDDSEVTGHPLVDLILSSDVADGDVFAYLEDVSPDGSSLLVTEGQLRANYFRLVKGGPSPSSKPNLPWHGFSKADYVPQPFANGRKLGLHFDMMPTSWVFAKGHRIRVSFAGADWPSFRLHPSLSPANDPVAPNTIRPNWTIWRGAGLSGITLPLIPDRK